MNRGRKVADGTFAEMRVARRPGGVGSNLEQIFLSVTGQGTILELRLASLQVVPGTERLTQNTERIFVSSVSFAVEYPLKSSSLCEREPYIRCAKPQPAAHGCGRLREPATAGRRRRRRRLVRIFCSSARPRVDALERGAQRARRQRGGPVDSSGPRPLRPRRPRSAAWRAAPRRRARLGCAVRERVARVL